MVIDDDNDDDHDDDDDCDDENPKAADKPIVFSPVPLRAKTRSNRHLEKRTSHLASCCGMVN